MRKDGQTDMKKLIVTDILHVLPSTEKYHSFITSDFLLSIIRVPALRQSFVLMQSTNFRNFNILRFRKFR
jgi:hypothetical protein